MKKMVLKEQEHQHNLDKDYLEKDFSLKKMGQILAFLLCVIALVGGFWTVLQGFEIGGTIIAALGLGGIVAQFLKSS